MGHFCLLIVTHLGGSLVVAKKVTQLGGSFIVAKKVTHLGGSVLFAEKVTHWSGTSASTSPNSLEATSSEIGLGLSPVTQL